MLGGHFTKISARLLKNKIPHITGCSSCKCVCYRKNQVPAGRCITSSGCRGNGEIKKRLAPRPFLSVSQEPNDFKNLNFLKMFDIDGHNFELKK